VVALPEFRKLVRALDQVIRVDYTAPGLSPTPKLLLAALQAILKGELPLRGDVLAPDTALCEECPRKASKPTDLAYSEFHRPTCASWILNSASWRKASSAWVRPPAADARRLHPRQMPARDASATSHVRDQGAKMALGNQFVDWRRGSRRIDQILAGIPDPVGTFYRYGLPHCRCGPRHAVSTSPEE